MLKHKSVFPENQVYTYDNSESPTRLAPRPDPSPPDALSLLDESARGPNQGGAPRAKGEAGPRPRARAPAPDDPEEQDQLKISRCLSDPGPNKDGEGDGSFLS